MEKGNNMKNKSEIMIHIDTSKNVGKIEVKKRNEKRSKTERKMLIKVMKKIRNYKKTNTKL